MADDGGALGPTYFFFSNQVALNYVATFFTLKYDANASFVAVSCYEIMFLQNFPSMPTAEK